MKKSKKRNFEWSKIICGLLVLYGISNGVVYNVAIFMDKMPDASLAVQSVITIVGGYMSYLMYQFGLKNSRNKYGIDNDGVPYSQRVEDLYGYDEECYEDENESYG